MIQGLVSNWALPGRRRVGALLLAVCLNLSILPCAMALEVVEQGHDCCPPEIQLESSICCELDDVSVDSRSDVLKLNDQPDTDSLPMTPGFRVLDASPEFVVANVDPPDSPDHCPPLYKLHCVYLK